MNQEPRDLCSLISCLCYDSQIKELKKVDGLKSSQEVPELTDTS
jgi:hypothetical protein